MKKTLIVLAIIMSTSLIAQLRVSADMGGTATMDILGIELEGDTEMGFTLGYDHILGNASGFDYGAGLEYQLNRAMDEDAPKFGFTSIYGVGKYSINESMYAGVRVGYALMFSGDDDFWSDSDKKGGIMYGVGGGYNINDQMAVEVGYNSNAGTIDDDVDFTYNRLAISFLYSF